jgi:hypothetical protein
MDANVPTLNGRHARTLEQIMDHQSRNVEWRDIVHLFEHLGNVVERHDGKFDFQVGQASAVLTKPHGKDATVDELVILRKLLSQAGLSTAPPALHTEVVLIDHEHAGFFEPDATGAHLRENGHVDAKNVELLRQHLREGQYQGERAPEAIEFYERVAERLKSAPSVVLIGDGTGKSSGMLDFLEYLREKHKDIAEHVSGMADADLSSIALPVIEKIALAHQPA